MKIYPRTTICQDDILAEQKTAIMEACRQLSRDTRWGSWSKDLDSIGFNRYDSELGDYIASLEMENLTDQEARQAYRMLQKYHQQIDMETYEAIYERKS
ncbi:MAG: hypothetical protein A2W23_04855 [Planctomycetes bacterium RBG_16_43_13]|nr:MAG: hypothetical protein A2W23_04855 [Planctomycetes bacterium RBG_16_43_13]